MNPVPGLQIEQQPEGVLLRMLMWGEARGEQDQGGRLESIAMLAVAWVARNRAIARKQDMRTVILAPWQFSCFNVNDPNRDKMLVAHKLDPVSWERADTVADLFEAGLTSDPSHGADHYVTLSLWNRDALDPESPQWFEAPLIAATRTTEVARYGHHVFARHA